MKFILFSVMTIMLFGCQSDKEMMENARKLAVENSGKTEIVHATVSDLRYYGGSCSISASFEDGFVRVLTSNDDIMYGVCCVLAKGNVIPVVRIKNDADPTTTPVYKWPKADGTMIDLE